MDLLIVSDLHIESAEDRLLNSLNLLLVATAKAGDRVILAGDIFDLYVGNKKSFRRKFWNFHQAIQVAGHRGVRVDYIEGNHDFQLNRVFGAYGHVQVHPTELVVSDQGNRFFISHGDLANQTDYRYRVLRFVFRSWLMRAFIASAPDRWIEAIGRKSSEESRRSRLEECDHHLTELRRVYRNYAAEKLLQGFDYVVMGHCHDLDDMRFKLGERLGAYFNVGYPRKHGLFLKWSSKDRKMTREPLPMHPALVKSTDWHPSSNLSY